jgi:hypothetical protein
MALIENPVEDLDRELQIEVIDKTSQDVKPIIAALKEFSKKHESVGYYCTAIRYAPPEAVMWHLVFKTTPTDVMKKELLAKLQAINPKFHQDGLSTAAEVVACPCKAI